MEDTVWCEKCGHRLGTIADNKYVTVRVVNTKGEIEQMLDNGILCPSCAKKTLTTLTTCDVDHYTAMHIHNHRAEVQLSRMERMLSNRDLWIVCKELTMAFKDLEHVVQDLKDSINAIRSKDNMP